MPELLESELVGVEVDAPPRGLFPPGDVRRRPEGLVYYILVKMLQCLYMASFR
jgi:hypothetical protein